jgi:hypothetical protein
LILIASVMTVIALGFVGWTLLSRGKSEFSVGAVGYVYIEDDGSARDLTANEADYLTLSFTRRTAEGLM